MAIPNGAVADSSAEVWVVYPRTRTVVIHESSVAARTLSDGDVIEGRAILPGFRLEVAEIFRF